jgi:hypothetical protein
MRGGKNIGEHCDYIMPYTKYSVDYNSPWLGAQSSPWLHRSEFDGLRGSCDLIPDPAIALVVPLEHKQLAVRRRLRTLRDREREVVLERAAVALRAYNDAIFGRIRARCRSEVDLDQLA